MYDTAKKGYTRGACSTRHTHRHSAPCVSLCVTLQQVGRQAHCQHSCKARTHECVICAQHDTRPQEKADGSRCQKKTKTSDDHVRSERGGRAVTLAMAALSLPPSLCPCVHHTSTPLSFFISLNLFFEFPQAASLQFGGARPRLKRHWTSSAQPLDPHIGAH